MSAQHTPGRLYLLQKYKTVAHAEQGTRGRRVFDADSMGDQTENEANARRLVACWNACEGISTEALERGPLSEAFEREQDRADSAGRQRDELLAALEGLTGDIQALIGESDGVAGLHMNGDVAPWGELEAGGRFERLTHLPTAHAAIAKVKGGAV